MDEFKGTPEPWRVSAGAVDNPRLIVESDLGLPVCAMSLRGVHGDINKMEANARLIAAAPELLEALQKMVKMASTGMVDFNPHDELVMSSARAAIAKALGEAK